MGSSHQRARKRREQLELTQKHVAKACRVTQQAYEKFERGETKRPRYIYELAKALNISAAWLLTGEGSDLPEGNSSDPHKNKAHEGSNNGKVPLYIYSVDIKSSITSFDDADAIDRLPPLPGLENTTGAIALFIQGDGLEPVYPHGSIIYLDCNKYPSKNKPCVSISADGMQTLLYLGNNNGNHHFRHMHSGKSSKIKAKEIKALYRIIGVLYD